jgi:hypothetical protein
MDITCWCYCSQTEIDDRPRGTICHHKCINAVRPYSFVTRHNGQNHRLREATIFRRMLETAREPVPKGRPTVAQDAVLGSHALSMSPVGTTGSYPSEGHEFEERVKKSHSWSWQREEIGRPQGKH